MADAVDLRSTSERSRGSSPLASTIYPENEQWCSAGCKPVPFVVGGSIPSLGTIL